MSNNKLFRIMLLACAGWFFSPQTSEAQILKAMKNTVQGSVKDVTKKVKKAKGKAVEEIAEQVEEALPAQYQFNPEIWFLEDKESKYPELYAKTHAVEPDSQLAEEQEEAYLHGLQNLEAGRYNHWILVEGNKYMPEYVIFTYPYARNFMLNPTEDNFRLFARTYAMQYLTLDMEDVNGIIDSKEGKLLYNPKNNTTVNSAMGAIREEVVNYAVKKFTPEQYAKFIIDACKETEALLENPSAYPDNKAKLYAGAGYTIARNMETDIHWNQDLRISSDDRNEIQMHFKRVSDTYLKVKQLLIAASVGAQPVPEGVKVSSTLQSQMVAAAKKVYGANLVKVVPLANENRWHIYKSDKYPFEEINRALDCVCVYKKDGKTMWRECTYQINAKTKAKAIQPGEIEYEVKE